MRTHARTHAHTHTHVCTHTHTHTRTHTHTHTHAHPHTCTPTHRHTCTQTPPTHKHTPTYTHTHTLNHTHTNTHTHEYSHVIGSTLSVCQRCVPLVSDRTNACVVSPGVPRGVRSEGRVRRPRPSGNHTSSPPPPFHLFTSTPVTSLYIPKPSMHHDLLTCSVLTGATWTLGIFRTHREAWKEGKTAAQHSHIKQGYLRVLLCYSRGVTTRGPGR